MSARATLSRLLPLLALILLPASGLAQTPSAPAQSVGERKQVPGGSYWDISVEQLQTMLQAKNFPLINVHVPFQGDLPLTDASIPFDQVMQHMDELPSDKTAPVVLYCRSGRMSTEAATMLASMGYTNVYNLVGGFNAWGAAGLPVLQTPVNP